MQANERGDNFSQAELDKFGALAQRWWGERARLRTTGSRVRERPRTLARAGAIGRDDA
ncbi:hypothetical protein GCM10028862_02530 [Luteimonas pelagia]